MHATLRTSCGRLYTVELEGSAEDWEGQYH